MLRGIYQNASAYKQLLITLLVAFSMYFLSSIFAVLVAIPLYHLQMDQLQSLFQDVNDPETVAFLKFLQIIISLALFVFSSLLLGYMFSSNNQEYLRLQKQPTWILALLAILLVTVIFPFINMVSALNSQIEFPSFMKGVEDFLKHQEQTNQNMMDAFLKDTNLRGLFVNLVMIGVIPAVGEELFFRGVLQRIFTKMTGKSVWAILITAALFSLIHGEFTGFFPRMFLGALFGYLLVWSGSIWVPIIAHFVNNVTAVVLYYFVNIGTVEKSVPDYGTTPEAWPAILLSAALTAALLYYFHKYAVKPEKEVLE